MDRLFKSEKQLAEFKDTIDILSADTDNLKDKKIVELAKKNKALFI